MNFIPILVIAIVILSLTFAMFMKSLITIKYLILNPKNPKEKGDKEYKAIMILGLITLLLMSTFFTIVLSMIYVQNMGVILNNG